MSTLPGPRVLKQQRKNTLRLFYVFVVLAAGTFTVAGNSSQAPQQALYASALFWLGEEFGVSFDSSKLLTHIRDSSTTKQRVLRLLALYSSRLRSASCNDSGSFLGPRSSFRR